MTTPRQWWRWVRLSRRNGIVAGGGAAAVVALVTALTVTLTSGGHSKTVAATPTPTPTRTRAVTPAKRPKPRPRKPKPKPINPLTGGRPSTNSVVAVKIDDTAAGRPQRGIDSADIVYVEQAEGGLTRLLAVYDSRLTTVEPVRSTRAGDEVLASQFGRIDYVASGGSAGELQPLDKSSLRSDINDRGGPGFGRDSGRAAPYNLMANLAVIASKLHGQKARDFGLVWSRQIVNPGTRPGAAVQTVVGGTPVAFGWSTRLHRYARVIGGAIQYAADGAPIATPNVIVQFCRITLYPQDVDTAGNPAEYTHTVGKGRVAVFRNGRRIDGTWSRASEASGTHLTDSHGKPIALAPGGAWFILVATTASLR